ncbi:MAG: ATP synthase F1 subunit gamma [Candidatus Kapabacteria bacterium]|jgi:F-type H+-transporting ATPase subunit gamma|nr:ATP synthase F1 subunit gamma [Candidatus Kapabacteria bacterium]
MATLRDITLRKKSVTNTAKITQAMRMISAAQLRRAQENIESARPYVQKLGDVLTNLVNSVGDEYSHPLIKSSSDVKKIAVITIASDRGLCGGFNTNLFKLAMKTIEGQFAEEYPGAECFHFPVGKRTAQFIKKQDVKVVKEYIDIFRKLDFSHAKDIAKIVSDGFVSGEYDKVFIFFNKFVNIVRQEPSMVQLLPIESDAQEDASTANADYIYEPAQKSILDELLPKHIDIQVWRGLLESYAAEQAARMVAMQNATKNANDLIDHLELVFNKARQAVITTEMLEIVGGAEALSK